MKKCLYILITTILVLIVFGICVFISARFTSILFNHSKLLQSMLFAPASNNDSLIFWIKAAFIGPYFVNIVWGVLFLPMFGVAMYLFDKYIQPIINIFEIEQIILD